MLTSDVADRLRNRPGLFALMALTGCLLAAFAVYWLQPRDGYPGPLLSAAGKFAEDILLPLAVLVAVVAVGGWKLDRYWHRERSQQIRGEERVRSVQTALAVVFVVSLAWVAFRQATMHGDVRSPPFLAAFVAMVSLVGVVASVPAALWILARTPPSE